MHRPTQANMRSEEEGALGGGGSGTQKFVFHKWPDQIFPMVHFGVSHDGHFGLGGGGVQGGRGGQPPPPSSCGSQPF